MRTRASIALLIPLACLLGCTLPYTPSPLSGNWQIQSGTAITSPATGTYLTGALQSQGSQITGTFITDYATIGNTGVVNMTGTYDTSTRDLAFATTPAYLGVDLTETSDPTTVASGNLYLGCLPPPAGSATCTVIALVPAVGVEIAPLNGTYTGTLTESSSSLSSPIPSATVSLVLTQASIPNAYGLFPLTGTLTFNGGGCSSSYSISTTISGIGIPSANIPSMPSPSQAIQLPAPVTIIGYTNPTASQITVSSLDFYPSPCSTVNSSSTTYQGVLTRQ
jgi:hypothetical protein